MYEISTMKENKILTVILLCLLVTIFTGCSKKGTCEACGKKAVLYRFTTTTGVLGINQTKTTKLCEDCLDDAIRAIDVDGMGLTTYTYEEIK